MTNLSVFDYHSTEIRIVFENNQFWWVAADLCKALELANVSQAMTRLDEDEKGICSVYTPGGDQEMLCVSESGLYSLVLTSRKKQAKTFKKWITSDVLPSIRKTGSYSVKEQELVETPTPRDIADFVTTILSITGVEKPLIAASAANHIAKYYPVLRPVAEDLKKELVVEIEEKLLTPTEIGAILEQRTGQKHSAQRVNKLLAEAGLQKRNPNGKDPAWLPTPKGSEFSKLLLAAQKGAKDTTRQHLQWYEGVVEVLAS